MLFLKGFYKIKILILILIENYKLFACQSLRSFFISIVTCQSLISIFILAVNAFGCFYSALCIINSLSDDHIALNILAAFLILINTPLVFATDGGFFERFARSVIDGLAACLNRLKTRGTDFKYKGLGVYRSEVSSEQVGLLAPNDDLFDNQELPMTSYVPREPVGKRVWKHLTSMEGCFDDLLRQPENLSSKAKAAWFVMQVIIGSVNALIEAGFAWLVFDKFFQADNFLLFCIMGSVFLQNLALDGAVSASTLVTVIDAESRSKPKSWATFWMTILLLITCTTQAAALGYVGTEQLLEKLGWSTSWLATLVCVLGGLLKAIPNVGVELKAFRDKFDKMFPFDQTRESILDWGPINGGEGDGALALAHQPTL